MCVIYAWKYTCNHWKIARRPCPISTPTGCANENWKPWFAENETCEDCSDGSADMMIEDEDEDELAEELKFQIKEEEKKEKAEKEKSKKEKEKQKEVTEKEVKDKEAKDKDAKDDEEWRQEFGGLCLGTDEMEGLEE